MKMEQIKLAEEASQYKKYVEDMNEMNSTIQSTSKFQGVYPLINLLFVYCVLEY